MQRGPAALWAVLRECERSKVPVSSGLRNLMLDPGAGWYTRGMAARVLAAADAKRTITDLLTPFFAQKERTDLLETALTIESFGDTAAVRPLIRALKDPNPHRRHAAARALGWIPNAGPRAALALIDALLDKFQPQPVREEAAESLAYSNCVSAIAPLISVLDEPDVRIRFWAVFALGGVGSAGTGDGADLRVIEALERMLSDGEVAPGNWWSVGREALAMLAKLTPKYNAMLAEETARALSDANASVVDQRWAECYKSRQ